MANKTLLPRRLIPYRQRIFKLIWNQYKGDLTMTEVSEILRYQVSQFYKIISKRKKKQ